MKIASGSLVICMVAASGCASSVTPSGGGSESHFMLTCVDNSDCGSLTCAENLCTTECESTTECAPLGASVTCETLGALRVCDTVCEDDDDCEGLGDNFECSFGRCRLDLPPRAPDASVIDASQPEGTAELLGTSDALSKPDLAFVARTGSEERVWVRGEAGALRHISTWPSELVEQGLCDRFSALSFSAGSEYLAFTETLECFERGRVVVHDLATGQTWSLGTFEASYVDVSAGPRSMIASVVDGSIFDVPAKLFQIDLDAMRLEPIETPVGNLVNGSHQQVVGIGAGLEVVITNGQPVMILTEDGAYLFEPIDSLGPNWQHSELRASPSGSQVCINARHTMSGPGMDVARAILATATGGSTQVIPELASSCVFSGSGDYVMVGRTAFEIVDDELVPLPLPSVPLQAAGSFDEIFYATNEDSEVVTFDPATGAIDVVVDVEALEELCPDAPGPVTTSLSLPEDGRRVGLGIVHCSMGDEFDGVSLALDLATGAFTKIDVRSGFPFNVHDMAWPEDGGALLFVPAETDEEPSFFEIGPGPEITRHMVDEVEGILRTPAVAR